SNVQAGDACGGRLGHQRAFGVLVLRRGGAGRAHSSHAADLRAGFPGDAVAVRAVAQIAFSRAFYFLLYFFLPGSDAGIELRNAPDGGARDPMRSSLSQRVKEALERRRLAAPGDRLGVAVSGGADSVALVRLLHSLQDELGIRLAVLHFQHGLRGEESAGDERFTAELAGGLGLEFLREEADVAAWAKSHRVNLEDAGRQLRTGFFERMVRDARVTRVATAHTADDQAETLL